MDKLVYIHEMENASKWLNDWTDKAAPVQGYELFTLNVSNKARPMFSPASETGLRLVKGYFCDDCRGLFDHTMICGDFCGARGWLTETQNPGQSNYVWSLKQDTSIFHCIFLKGFILYPEKKSLMFLREVFSDLYLLKGTLIVTSITFSLFCWYVCSSTQCCVLQWHT